LPPIVVPTDVTRPLLPPLLYFATMADMAAQGGIQSTSQFPREQDLGGDAHWIMVRKEDATLYTRPSPFTVDFKYGRILVGVKKPSNAALVYTPLGQVAISANGDVLVSWKDNVLRVDNLDGTGQTVKVRLDKGIFAGHPAQVAIAPGFEVTASEKTLTAHDLHPHDGVARRHFRTLQNGKFAVSEISVESAIHNVSAIVQMSQQTQGAQDRKMLSDMSKMAAVLNYMHGSDGFTEGQQ
jgi:hypothetical protein